MNRSFNRDYKKTLSACLGNVKLENAHNISITDEIEDEIPKDQVIKSGNKQLRKDLINAAIMKKQSMNAQLYYTARPQLKK